MMLGHKCPQGIFLTLLWAPAKASVSWNIRDKFLKIYHYWNIYGISASQIVVSKTKR